MVYGVRCMAVADLYGVWCMVYGSSRPLWCMPPCNQVNGYKVSFVVCTLAWFGRWIARVYSSGI
jgi:hypothetical protein